KGNEGLVFSTHKSLKDFLIDNNPSKDILLSLETWLKNKEFYVNQDDYQEVDLGGEKQSYLNPTILNDLFIIVGDEKFQEFSFSEKNTNFHEVLKYSPDQPLL